MVFTGATVVAVFWLFERQAVPSEGVLFAQSALTTFAPRCVNLRWTPKGYCKKQKGTALYCLILISKNRRNPGVIGEIVFSVKFI